MALSFGGQIFTPYQFERHAHKSSSRNWKLLICCRGKPLSTFVESYETSDGKKQWQFVTSDSDLGDCVPPDQPVTSPDADAMLSDASISSPDTGNYPAPDLCCSLPDFEPTSNPVFTWGPIDSETFCHLLEANYSDLIHWKNNCLRSLLDILVKKLC